MEQPHWRGWRESAILGNLVNEWVDSVKLKTKETVYKHCNLVNKVFSCGGTG